MFVRQLSYMGLQEEPNMETKDFIEMAMAGITPKLETTVLYILQALSEDSVLLSAAIGTDIYQVEGNRIGKGVRLEIEYPE